jgi:hypothetical protein
MRALAMAGSLAPRVDDCEPWSVPEEARCQYITDRAGTCHEDQLLLRLYFCVFAGWWV